MPKSPRPAPRRAAVRRVHYILSTHWDREWLQPLQVFRHRLVRLMDRTIAALESGELRGPFTTDGQSIVLDDYLEVRMQRRPAVERLVRSGRLNAGPWYVLPEEWLVSGEALVRNLRLGRQIVRDLGGRPSAAGFACDLFGHLGQLPQVFAGFGLKGVFLWRGIEPRASAHFIWAGADGTRLPAYRFGRAGYGDYAYDVRRGTQLDVWFDAARSRADHLDFIRRESARTTVPPVLLFDGCDHLEFDSDHYRVLQSLEQADGLPGPLVHSTLDAYLRDLAPHVAGIGDVVHGELREFARQPLIRDQQWLIPGVLSSRMPLKLENAACQTLLCHWAEPFALLARRAARGEDPADFLAVAWRWLLQNHPHDSIGGCSIDEVHRDMLYRFAQCRQIGERLADEALRTLAASVPGEIGERELRVLVANPQARPLTEPCELTLQIPVDWRTFQEFFGFEAQPAFRVFGPDGRELPYQRVAQRPGRNRYRAASAVKFPQPYQTHDVTVVLRLDLPALGYTTLTVREGAAAPGDSIIAPATLPTRHPAQRGLATSERSMANEFLAVAFEANGTLTLTDRRSGDVYSRLLTFEDGADIGDGWYYGPAVNDQIFLSTTARSELALVCNGPLLTCFRLRTTLRLPAEFRFDRMVRAAEFADCVIESLVTLRAGCDRVEVRITVHNQVRDHRLRVLFPTGAQARTYLADSAFDVVERPIALLSDSHLHRELPVETGPQQSWTAVHDARRGLAVVAPGILESAVRDLPDRPLALTLLRATRRTIMSNGEPDGQVQGELIFDCWISPLSGPPDRTRLLEQGIQLGAGLRTAQLTRYDAKVTRCRGEVGPRGSLLSVEGPIVVTSVREVDGATEVRLFNPTGKAVKAALGFAGGPDSLPVPRAARMVNLESRPLGRPVAIRRGRLEFTVQPKQIVTWRLRP